VFEDFPKCFRALPATSFNPGEEETISAENIAL
jgi:hypothetical protein